MIEKRGFMSVKREIRYGKEQVSQELEKAYSGSKIKDQKGSYRPYKTIRADCTVD